MFTLIQDKQDLIYLNKEFLTKDYLAIDTEFRRTGKQEIKLGLMQVRDEDEIFIIDPILIEDPKSSCSFLNSDKVVKIFHSFREDIDAINSWTNEEVRNIFDTQLANAFLGGTFSIGYQDLVKQELGVLISKNETRSNWLKRPLRDSQLRYAASDVEFLLEVYRDQAKRLEKLNRTNWLTEEITTSSKGSSSFKQDYKNCEKKQKLSKESEKEFLNLFNTIISEVSKKQNINKTLLFSKREQKFFLKLVELTGKEMALNEVQEWKRKLILSQISNLINEFEMA